VYQFLKKEIQLSATMTVLIKEIISTLKSLSSSMGPPVKYTPKNEVAPVKTEIARTVITPAKYESLATNADEYGQTKKEAIAASKVIDR
jgi:hypothetical protein